MPVFSENCSISGGRYGETAGRTCVSGVRGETDGGNGVVSSDCNSSGPTSGIDK